MKAISLDLANQANFEGQKFWFLAVVININIKSVPNLGFKSDGKK